MTINLGTTNINKLYLGNTEITKVYLGSTLVYSNTPPTTYILNSFVNNIGGVTIDPTTGIATGFDSDTYLNINDSELLNGDYNKRIYFNIPETLNAPINIRIQFDNDEYVNYAINSQTSITLTTNYSGDTKQFTATPGKVFYAINTLWYKTSDNTVTYNLNVYEHNPDGTGTSGINPSIDGISLSNICQYINIGQTSTATTGFNIDLLQSKVGSETFAIASTT